MHNEFLEMRAHAWLADLGLYVRRAQNVPWGTARMLYEDVVPRDQPAVILDIGANVGQTSRAYAHSFPDATIHAFEPFPRIHAVCRQNLRKFPRIHCHCLAVGDQCEKRVIALATEDNHCTFNQITRPAGADTPAALREEIQVTTLDAFLREQRIPTVHILKTDTEGNELAVFRGGHEALTRGAVRSILVEATLQEGNTFHVRLEVITSCLAPLHFRFYGLYDISYTPTGEMHVFSALYKLQPPSPSVPSTVGSRK